MANLGDYLSWRPTRTLYLHKYKEDRREDLEGGAEAVEFVHWTDARNSAQSLLAYLEGRLLGVEGQQLIVLDDLQGRT